MNTLLISLIFFVTCSWVGYYFFYKKSSKKKFNLRDKENNRFFNFDNQF